MGWVADAQARPFVPFPWLVALVAAAASSALVLSAVARGDRHRAIAGAVTASVGLLSVTLLRQWPWTGAFALLLVGAIVTMRLVAVDRVRARRWALATSVIGASIFVGAPVSWLIELFVWTNSGFVR